MSTFYKMYTEALNEDMIIPASGKRLYIWDVFINSDEGIDIVFPSGNTIVARHNKNSPSNRFEFFKDSLGSVNEPLHITCTGAGTVKILYGEV